MAEWVKELAVKSENLCLIPETHMMGGENRLWQTALCPHLLCVGLYSRNIKTIEIL